MTGAFDSWFEPTMSTQSPVWITDAEKTMMALADHGELHRTP